MNKVISYIRYFLLFVCIYWLATVIEGVEGFDLHRSYEEAQYYADNFSIELMILYRLVKTIDFIYYLIHYYAIKSSISPNLVTASIVFVYYCLIIYATQKIYGRKVGYPLLIITLFTAPSIYIISVARNLTAFMFLFCAIVSYYKGHRVFSALFTIVAVFTHFTTLMYVALLIASLYLKNKQIKDQTLTIVLLFAFFTSLIAPTFIKDTIFDIIGGHDLYYENYSNEIARNYLLLGFINYSDKLPATFALVYSVVLLYLNKRRGMEFWALLMSTIMLLFFMNSSFPLVIRCMMFLSICWGLNVGNIMKYSPGNSIKNMQVLSSFGLLFLLLHIYGYRQIYLAFL